MVPPAAALKYLNSPVFLNTSFRNGRPKSVSPLSLSFSRASLIFSPGIALPLKTTAIASSLSIVLSNAIAYFSGYVFLSTVRVPSAFVIPFCAETVMTLSTVATVVTQVDVFVIRVDRHPSRPATNCQVFALLPTTSKKDAGLVRNGKIQESLNYLIWFVDLDKMTSVLHHNLLRATNTGLNRLGVVMDVRDVRFAHQDQR